MKTYQDFIESKEIKEFILEAIQDFKNSYMYERAILAQQYYSGNNPTIMSRLKWFWSSMGREKDNFKANNLIPSEFYPEIVKQENSYLFSNGVNFNDKGDKIKTAFGKNFDSTVFTLGNYSLVDGVAWLVGTIQNGEMNFTALRGTEFIPLIDERTSEIKAGIRFWQIESTRPMWVEFYELDGVTEYRVKDGVIEEYTAKRGYTENQTRNILGEVKREAISYPFLPVIPLYANDLGESTLTQALQNKIDVYDLVISDFANNLEDSQDVYWVLKNYAGTSVDTFLNDYKRYKTIKVDEDGGATPNTIDVPYEARKEMLEILKKDIYSSAMALNVGEMTGSSLTTTAIKAAMEKLNLKTDILESNALSCLNRAVELYTLLTNQQIDFNIELIRRTLVNDAEEIDMIYTFREDIDLRTALELNPRIPNEKIDEIIARKEEEGIQFEEPQTEININEE